MEKLKRKTTSTLSVGKSKEVKVEVRKKRTYVKRSDVEEQQRQAEEEAKRLEEEARLKREAEEKAAAEAKKAAEEKAGALIMAARNIVWFSEEE